MFELDKTNFAKFLSEQRKAKGYTQKELAEKLFISDKAVSKWERSLSMPDISLLVPLAEILEVSVTELLEGRRLDPGSEMNAGKVEELVKKALTLSEETPENRQIRKERRRKNALIFCSCTLLMILEALGGMWLLNRLMPKTESPAAFMASLGGFISILTLGGLSFGFGIYFWFFIKERLPLYYDENKISVYADGMFNLSMPGINFNNSSWPHMTKALRIWSAVTMLTITPICLLPAFFSEFFPVAWLPFCLQMTAIFLYLAGMFVPLYVLDRKYGSKNMPEVNETWTAGNGALSAENCDSTDTNRTLSAERYNTTGMNRTLAIRKQQKITLIIFVLTMLCIAFLVPLICRTVGVTRSGIRIGCVQQYTMQEWSASYRCLDGTMSKTIYPKSGSDAYIIEVETTQGTLSIEMTDRTGNVVFSAGDIQPGAYEVTISGATRVKITGKDHAGGFSISTADK